MKMGSLLILIALFHTSNSWSGERAQTGAVEQGATNSAYGSYLNCLNRLDYPVANGLHLSPDDKGRSNPSESPTLFYGKTKSKKGILLITPNEATLDEVPLYQPPPSKNGQGMPEYPLKVRRPDGTYRYYHYYTDKQRDRGDAASYGEEGFIEHNPNTPFYDLGSPSKKISPSDAIDAITGEAIPRMESMPKVKQRGKDWDEATAAGTLCSCVQTQNAKLVQKSKEIASQLGIKPEEIEKCDQPLVSRFFWKIKTIQEIFMSEAVAATGEPHGPMSVGTFSQPVLIRMDDRFTSYCVAGAAYKMNLMDGTISRLGKKCSMHPMRVLSSTHFRAQVGQNSIDFQILNK
jgi:hypothetical protein